MIKKNILRTILFGLPKLLSATAMKHPAFAKQMTQQDAVVQIKLKNNSLGRYLTFKQGKLASTSGIHSDPDVAMVFKNVDVALTFLNPNQDFGKIVHAAKNFLVELEGEDEKIVWVMQLLAAMGHAGAQFGVPRADGCQRFTTITNGGPLHVDVRDGKVVRLVPIKFDDDDAPSWTIRARGRAFSPQRRATVAPHALNIKSSVYSEDRILYPMKRVDFDPDGERNPQNRGISGYERISWDEALDIVAKEINRQKKEHGPGSIVFPMSSHHQWGNVGYYLSSLTRFANLIGFTRLAANPDSWEGWYWGASHHYGATMRIGVGGCYGTVEDCLQEAEQMVFWSSDTESTNGAYMGFEGTQRRQWAKELGIKFIHIDPHYNPTAQLLGGTWFDIRPGTDAALALSIMYVWLTEELYDKEYVAERTTGFDEWSEYLLGKDDQVPKTPEWQESETGIPARKARALARSWAKRKTYLAAGAQGTGFGGACRGANGAQWARCMIQMMAMQGWGKPGINMGNLQGGTPVDYHFYFPGYADGGISGDLSWTANPVNNYQRMPHVLTINPVKQLVPKQQFPEAIIEGTASGYLWDGSSHEAQFTPFTYPMKGYSPIKMIYRYGGSAFSTLTESARMVDAYRHDSIECVVNQSIWMEGEAEYADIILPACTNLERFDIGEWGSAGGYLQHGFDLLNHRVIALQHKCIEPLGESKSDYRIFTELLSRLGLGAMFTEGCSELDWAKRVFDSSDLPQHISWKEFLKKGYFVVPAEEEALRSPVVMRWFAEGRRKDLPEPQPLPSQFAEQYGMGLQTPSGKLEFIPETLKRLKPENPERPVVNRYIPSWEGRASKALYERYPLQIVISHSRYSFHTHGDGKDSFINDIDEHRLLVNDHYYWLVRLSPKDAADRGIKHHDLVKVFNDRGAVICAAVVAPLLADGVVKSFESSSNFDLRSIEGHVVDVGGSMNILTSSRSQSSDTSSMAPNACLVQIEPWPYSHLGEKLQRDHARRGSAA